MLRVSPAVSAVSLSACSGWSSGKPGEWQASLPMEVADGAAPTAEAGCVPDGPVHILTSRPDGARDVKLPSREVGCDCGCMCVQIVRGL